MEANNKVLGFYFAYLEKDLVGRDNMNKGVHKSHERLKTIFKVVAKDGKPADRRL